MRLGTNYTGAVSFGTYATEGRQIYGDLSNVAKDAQTIQTIIDRQGTDLILEVLANHIGNVNHRFGLGAPELERLVKNLNDSLIELINERI